MITEEKIELQSLPIALNFKWKVTEKEQPLILERYLRDYMKKWVDNKNQMDQITTTETD
jgi:hypothetical protein